MPMKLFGCAIMVDGEGIRKIRVCSLFLGEDG